MVTMNIKKSQSPAVDKVLDIFEYLKDSKSPCTASALIKKLKLPNSTGFRIINTLIDRSYIIREVSTNNLRLGYKAIGLGNAALSQSDIRQRVRPMLEKITEKIEESAELAWMENFEIFFLEVTDSSQPVRLFRQTGMRILGMKNPVALAILSNLPQEERKKVISLANQTVKSMQKMNIDINQQGVVCEPDIDNTIINSIVENGYALDYGIYRKEVTRVAVPIMNKNGIATGALSAAGPTYRMGPKKQQEIIFLLKQYSENITQLLSHDVG